MDRLVKVAVFELESKQVSHVRLGLICSEVCQYDLESGGMS